MKHETLLPEDFDGTFRFTNWTDEDFTGVWSKKEYVFPARSTVPMVIPEHSPIEVQHIRKKFAKDLAEKWFFNHSEEYKRMFGQEKNQDGSARLNSIHQAGTYNIDMLAPLIQRCLEPLPISKATVKEVKGEKIEDKLSRNEDGELNTKALKQGDSLRQEALSK